MSIITVLFPPVNREAAVVAFLRTAWQTIRATTALGVAGGVTVTATKLATIDWPTVTYGVSAILLAGILAGALAAGDILVHGLPSSYTAPALIAGAVEPAVVPGLTVPTGTVTDTNPTVTADVTAAAVPAVVGE